MTRTSRDPRPSAEASRKASENGPSGSEFAGVGFQFVIAILAGVYAGQWLDKALGSAPWLLIIGLFLGAGLGFYSMYSKLMAAQRREDAEKKAQRDGKA
ncbi:hypothetical protein BH09GEM1_BH09GEM1_01950 [soil metagenome]